MPLVDVRSRLSDLVMLVLVFGMLLATGCMTHEQQMVLKVDRWMVQERYDAAISYLEGYLARHSSSLAGWRYRVLIRLEQGERATAAAEYADLNAALGRHEPEVLREVVLGAGGRWLLSDYRALARCGAAPVVTPDLFEQLLEPQLLGRAELSKVAVSDDEIGGVVDALPGGLSATETWPLVQRFASHGSPSIRARVVRAAGRHLASEELGEKASREALDALHAAAVASEVELREAALLSVLGLPEGEGRASFGAGVVTGLLAAGDEGRALSSFLLGPGGEGASGWTEDSLANWTETAQGALRVLAAGERFRRQENKKAKRVLDRAARSPLVSERLGAALYRGDSLAGVWKSLALEEQRTWAPVFVRAGGKDMGALASLVFEGTDGVLAQGAAVALALPGLGPNDKVDAALARALGSTDPSTRALAAQAAIVRGSTDLGEDIEASFRRDDDRVMLGVLRTLVETGSSSWPSLSSLGMASALGTVRELAVDALVANCRSESREQLLLLLHDDDPHVAVRAAAALYLLVGSGHSGEQQRRSPSK